MAWLICKKCRAGIHDSILTPEMRRVCGWPIDGKHRPGECDGDIEIIASDQQAGAGPGYKPRNGGSN